MASNILPYDGQAIPIHDNCPEFDLPTVTRTLIESIPWRTETARLFGRALPLPV